jgi:hypothetical protein
MATALTKNRILLLPKKRNRLPVVPVVPVAPVKPVAPVAPVTPVIPITIEHKDEVDDYKESMTNVLEPCKIPNSLNIEQMKDLIKKYMEPRTEYYRSKQRAPYVEDEFSEYYTAITTKGIEIGGGSCGMDVKTGLGEGIDAMCVIMNSTHSNEKSLIQNFSKSGENLDELFHKKDDATAVKLFISDYTTKLQKCKTEKGLNDLYILAFISTQTDVYLTAFQIHLEHLSNVSSGGFIGKNKDNYVNIEVNHFIHPNYGNVRLYKSKKRMELRLHANILKHPHTVKLCTMD